MCYLRLEKSCCSGSCEGFTNDRRFHKAVRAMTSSVEDISDADMLENFKKLVIVFDRMIRGKNLK